MVRRCRTIGWHSVYQMVEMALGHCPALDAAATVEGRIERLGNGLNHRNYLFRAKNHAIHAGDTAQAFVLRVPMEAPADGSLDDAVARLRNEARTLQGLARQGLPFDVPAFICFSENEKGACGGLIETALYGSSIQFQAKRPDRAFWVIKTTARVAQAVHALSVASFSHLPRHTDSRSHVLHLLDELPHEFLAQDGDARNAATWIQDHLPENRPAVLLHGDLLAQNILWDGDSDRLGVVDWEFAGIGDPAHDLAIVTRGHFKLVGLPNGVRKLLDQYHRAGGIPIRVEDVINHELLMILNWLWEAVQRERTGKHAGHGASQYRNQLRAALRRAPKTS